MFLIYPSLSIDRFDPISLPLIVSITNSQIQSSSMANDNESIPL